MRVELPADLVDELRRLSHWAEQHLSDTGLRFPEVQERIRGWPPGSVRTALDERLLRAVGTWVTVREVATCKRAEEPLDLLDYLIPSGAPDPTDVQSVKNTEKGTGR